MLFEFSIEVDETVEGGLIASTRTYEGEAGILPGGTTYAWHIGSIELDCLEITQERDGTWKRAIAIVNLPTDSPLFKRVAAEVMRQHCWDIDKMWHANAHHHKQLRESV